MKTNILKDKKDWAFISEMLPDVPVLKLQIKFSEMKKSKAQVSFGFMKKKNY